MAKLGFGYYKDEQGNIQVVEKDLAALKQAEYYIRQGCTMQSARDWLVQKTGKQITVPGLLKAIHYDSAKKSNTNKDTELNS